MPGERDVFEVFAESYDAIYKSFKNYAAEADAVAALVRQNSPGARTILDVAWGTGEHARLLAERDFVVDGLDINATFVRRARLKHPAGQFFEADMSDFQLARRYDAVICLFSSIGYLRTLDRVERIQMLSRAFKTGWRDARRAMVWAGDTRRKTRGTP